MFIQVLVELELKPSSMTALLTGDCRLFMFMLVIVELVLKPSTMTALLTAGCSCSCKC